MKIEIIIIYILCFLFLLIGLFLMFGFKEAKQCLGNPFVYGANEIENMDTGKLQCTCYFGNPKYNSFYFNNEEVAILTDSYIN